jgi:hypothetical protein
MYRWSAAAALGFLIAAPIGAAIGQSEERLIGGTVIESGSGAPLAGAQIQVKNAPRYGDEAHWLSATGNHVRSQCLEREDCPQQGGAQSR